MKKIILFAILLQAFGVIAQDKKERYEFTLKQAIEHALQYNYSAINANRDIEAAKKKIWETGELGESGY